MEISSKRLWKVMMVLRKFHDHLCEAFEGRKERE